MNNIVVMASEEIRDKILDNADCSHKSGDAKYSLYPLKEKETMVEVQLLVWGAIEKWVKENIIANIEASNE